MHLLGILTIGPSVKLLQQMAIDISFISIVVANVERVAQALVDLIKFEGTTYPVVGIATIVTITCVIKMAHMSRPDTLELLHISGITHRHGLLTPHRVIKVGLCPRHGLHTTFNHRILDLLNL